jgi:hypothetical protein
MFNGLVLPHFAYHVQLCGMMTVRRAHIDKLYKMLGL